MRILIAAQTYRPATNGAAVFTIRLAEGLARAGHQVMVLRPSERRHAYGTWQHGVRVEAISALPLAPLYRDIYVTPLPGRQVGRLLDGFRPDAVHIQDHYPLCRAALGAALARGVPVVGTNNFLPDNMVPQMPLLAPWRALIERLLWKMVLDVFNRAHTITAATETSADILRRQGLHRRVWAISSGVDLERFCPDPGVDRIAMRRRYGLDLEQPVFLFVGRLDPEKRLDVLLHALHRLGRDNLQLAIAGRGTQRAALGALADRLALGRQMVFAGYVPDGDLPALLNSVDVFVMPGEAELQCIAALEAMATGRPLLLADACALPELVHVGRNGYLFRAGDVEDAARGMARLLAERDRWPAMGAASLAMARTHSLDNTIRRYEELYRSLLVIRQAQAP